MSVVDRLYFFVFIFLKAFIKLFWFDGNRFTYRISMQYLPFMYRRPKYYSLYKANWRFVVFRNTKKNTHKMWNFETWFFFHSAIHSIVCYYCSAEMPPIGNSREFEIHDNIIINFNADNKLLQLVYFLCESLFFIYFEWDFDGITELSAVLFLLHAIHSRSLAPVFNGNLNWTHSFSRCFGWINGPKYIREWNQSDKFPVTLKFSLAQSQILCDVFFRMGFMR